MDSAGLILTEAVSQPIALEKIEKTDAASQAKKKQVAKDFESVFITRLLDEMKDTVGDWGFEKDGASQQIQGIFGLYLARDIADKGGVGLWTDIYEFLGGSDSANTTPESPGQPPAD